MKFHKKRYNIFSYCVEEYKYSQEGAYILDEKSNADIIRVQLPAEIENENHMFSNAYYFADRLITCQISLSSLPEDILKKQRVEIIESSEYRDRVKKIASEAFKSDRRFHLLKKTNAEIASAIISNYVDELDKYYLALFENEIIGFLALKECSENKIAIHLAAVDEKYRLTGAAQSLYTRAIADSAHKYKVLEGKISTNNMPVMNLYASFNARFSMPENIYLKENVCL